MKIYRTLVLRWVGNQYIKMYEDSYEYKGELELLCGASPQQNQIEASQQSFANQVQQLSLIHILRIGNQTRQVCALVVPFMGNGFTYLNFRRMPP